jgi:hypothetical protein
MAEKRSKKNIEEEQDRKANEELRRKAGKVRIMVPSDNVLSWCYQDSTKIKQDLQLKEAMKEAEQRKRGKGTVETRDCSYLEKCRQDRRCESPR